MLRDRQDDFDDNEDADLNGMIHQYNEDNELRRKINEMKKQKEENKRNEAVDIEDDAVFIPSSTKRYEEERIPDIRVDQDVEKTRVGFQDDSDKTLVIMDRKNKADGDYRREVDEATYTRNEGTLNLKREVEEDEDLRESVRKKKVQRNHDDDEELSEKDKKMNKTITYVIIGVLVVALLCGIGFGVKTLFFNGSSDKKTSDVEDEKETKKTPTKTTKKNTKKDTDIKDNTAVIKQLSEQQATYEEQLAQVERDITSAQNEQSSAQTSLDAITTLYNETDALNKQVSAIESANGVTTVDALKAKAQDACKVDKESDSCKSLTDIATQYETLKGQQSLKQAQYDAELKKETTYLNDKKTADGKIDTLSKQKTDLETKIADIITKLAQYNN